MDLLRVGLRASRAGIAEACAHYVPQAFAVAFKALGSSLKLLLGFLREPWVANSIQVMLFSTCFEAARMVWQTISTKAFHSLFVEVRIDHSDFAWDWCNDYLTANNVWKNPTSYQLVTQSKPGDVDGYLQPIFHPTPGQPEFWKWRGYWIKVFKEPGAYNYMSSAYA